ncbi:TIGR01777 family oxidoreductase [Parasulfitobacter algicola]|uniref:TIGR01777 family protein n=1 Tax=Parasulfitobacter algicola TaxID=2614809 RepID=A0ABX2IPN2_9RHOB|nr:TIGR01777 family oxidoreductase [Sulfitobacter algicola]NSX54837.1 TIGR01777 family protein [Sulfitobacter algicola]
MDNPVLWTLISIQVLMGAFDTLVHHEGTERLAWRASQKHELRLHGVRNFFYAVIFICFAWIEPHGIFTIILVAILIVEVLITLWDFVEEDLTRKLPATERVNHTLLALNYGAILALAAPYLWEWAFLPSGLTPVSYGWWSVMATVSAIGVGVFSARDLLAASRSDRLGRGDPAQLVSALKPRQRILVTGGTGFIGQRLVQALVAAGHRVTVLTRDIRKVDELAHPVRVVADLGQISDDEVFDAIVNLAGEPIANGLWTVKKRIRIIASRVDMTKGVSDLVGRLNHKPDCVISGSAVGWYGLQGDQTLDEYSRPEPAFVHNICQAWEDAAAPIEQLGVRLVRLRIGLVMGVDGGLLAKLLTPFEFGGGGRMGDGQQWMPWIEHDDMIRVIAFAMSNPNMAGPMNAVAPNPVRNEEFTQKLAVALTRPAFLHLPAWLLTTVLGDLARETMLGSQRVLPKVLLENGFTFRHTQLGPMLRQITGAKDVVTAKNVTDARAVQ